MKNEKVTLIYILGAGRSGSTILSTILGSHDKIFNTADLMQIYEYGCHDKLCNDGNTIFSSPFWQNVLKELKLEKNKEYFCDRMLSNNKLEYHSNFFNLLFLKDNKNKEVNKYIKEQEELILAISKVSGKKFIVDSSKYAGRALLLSNSKNIEVKYIYNIRDSRGVVNSFSKKVQSSRKPLSALWYYNVVNIMSQIVFSKIKSKNKLKIRYEDLCENYKETLNIFSNFLHLDFNDVLNIIDNNKKIDIGPVIEGNRMVKNKVIKLEKDEEWVNKISGFNKINYYLLSLPIMVLNKYFIFKAKND